VEPESSASAAPPEQALTEALFALSWPLPRTVEDADSALTRLEEVKAVLTALEQQSVGTEAWWAGQVDALATQSGFVLEWWRPVLRDPDLDWTLNHQAHLTADLATLASAGARLLDQIEPRAAEEAAEAAHARRVAQDKRWGPAAVPPFAPTGPRPGAPGFRPQPPSEVFGDAVPMPVPAQVPVQPGTGPDPRRDEDLNAPQFPPMPPATAGGAAAAGVAAAVAAAAAAAFDPDAPPVAAPPSIPAQAQAQGHQQPRSQGTSAQAQAHPQPQPRASSAPAQGHPQAQSQASSAPTHPHAPGQSQSQPHASAAAPVTDTGYPPASGPGLAQIPASAAFPEAAFPEAATDPSSASARHRRPAYDFDDPRGSAPPPAVYPQAGMPPRSPVVPGPGFGGPPQGRRLASGGYPPPDYGSGPFGFAGEDDDEPDSLVPAGLRRHQRRLLMQTGAILGAIGVLCWWAVYTLTSPSPHSSAASGETTHAAPGSTDRTVAAGGLTTPETSAATTAKPTDSASPPAAAPSTATSSVPDATTVSSVRVTLLGGSASVPQIVALITVDTAGTGQVTVTGSYYGASGSREVQAETDRWTLSGKTSYEYSVPIANTGYCGTEFHFTLSAGGRSDADQTEPGC